MGSFVFNEVIERKMPFFIFHILKTKTSTRAKLASLLLLLSCQYGGSFNRPLLNLHSSFNIWC